MFRASHTPQLSMMLDDLFTRDHSTIAKHLGVTVPTLRAWIRAGQAPRAAMLALFYETRWGYSLTDAQAFNDAQVERQWRQALQRENGMLRARIARLEAIGDFGAANAPQVVPVRL